MVATALVATIVLAAWTYLVVSYDSPLGTDNVVVVERSSTSNGSNDVLATLSFQDGAEDLDWASMLMPSFACSSVLTRTYPIAEIVIFDLSHIHVGSDVYKYTASVYAIQVIHVHRETSETGGCDAYF